MYEVIVECEYDCEAFEPRRVKLTTEDADEAIFQSAQSRDRLHKSWVEKVGA